MDEGETGYFACRDNRLTRDSACHGSLLEGHCAGMPIMSCCPSCQSVWKASIGPVLAWEVHALPVLFSCTRVCLARANVSKCVLGGCCVGARAAPCHSPRGVDKRGGAPQSAGVDCQKNNDCTKKNLRICCIWVVYGRQSPKLHGSTAGCGRRVSTPYNANTAIFATSECWS